MNYVSEYYLNNVTDIVKDMISEFPSDKFEKIVLLAGTAGALIEVENKPYIYEAINSCMLITSI